MISFYDILDIYAEVNNMDKSYKRENPRKEEKSWQRRIIYAASDSAMQ